MKRFEPEPTHGRPLVAEIRGTAGKLAVHCARDTGALWLFASGPRGGDLGELVVGAQRAAELLAWLDGKAPYLYGSQHRLWWRERGDDVWELVLAKSVMGRHLRLRMDGVAKAEVAVCLRDWALAALDVAS